eukprot:scaffold147731_cov28-Tisochrysis_lutea.AAC.4
MPTELVGTTGPDTPTPNTRPRPSSSASTCIGNIAADELLKNDGAEARNSQSSRGWEGLQLPVVRTARHAPRPAAV